MVELNLLYLYFYQRQLLYTSCIVILEKRDMMDKIYTKTGDKGYTTNLLNKRYSKSDIEMELQGGIDEINANIGFLRNLIALYELKCEAGVLTDIDDMLKKVQYDLYLIGIEVSTEFTEEYITEEQVKFLENQIDFMVDNTEPMKSFIYYSGINAATYSHVIRTIIRRVERIYVRALEASSYPRSYEYINRLSDYFFTFSRYINHLAGFQDEPMVLK
jgi:cob(I)alamin adenosyltransferase